MCAKNVQLLTTFGYASLCISIQLINKNLLEHQNQAFEQNMG